MINFVFVIKVVDIIIVVLGFCLAVWVYFANRKAKINQYFSLFTIFILLWIVCSYFLNLSSNSSQGVLWTKLGYVAAFLFLSSAYFFATVFSTEKHFPFLDKLVIFIGTVFCFISFFTNWLVEDVVYTKFGASPVLGKGAVYIMVAVTLLSLLILKIIFRKYIDSNKKERLKIQYFFLGLVIFIIANVVFNVILSSQWEIFPYYHLGNYSTIFLVVFTAYAITKHELMGIKTLLTQVLIVIISIILFLDVLFLSDNLTMQLLKIGILLAFLYFSRELIKSVRKERESRKELENTYKKINQYIKQLEKINENLEEKNNDLKAIFEASGKVTENLDSQKIAQDVVDSIPRSLGHLGDRGGILILYDKNKRIVYTYAITESEIVRKAKKLLNKPFKDHIQPIDEADNFTIKTIKTKKIYVGNKLEDFIAPTVNKNICGLIQKVAKAKSFVSIPLLSRGNIIGVIIFVGTKPVEEITQRDKNVLYMFSSHIGSAVENAQLYEQTNKQIGELSDLNEKLEKANQSLKELMDVKNEFLHITSHQLRTPLTILRGMISMWHEGDFDKLRPQDKEKMLNRIYLSAERLNNITNDMLDALELEGGFFKFQFHTIFLEEAIKEVVDILKPNYDKKGLYIKFDFDKNNMSEIEAEPNYIKQVFLNLIDNGCKYTKKGGVEINISKSKDYISVIIKDTGIGIGKRDQKKMFEKFTRGKNAVLINATGSGLGLFIAKKIIDGHHGKIEFYSDGVGRGSVVKVFLPVKQ